MSARRLMTRSYSGEGRSSYNNGDEGNGTSRPGSRSYLSNVRPENSASRYRYSQYRPPRSTLCSVMAQLTEETQPSFETTLKSKAVSETCNVKFTCVVTGYPTPEITWYKDDMQLDRYCGLPKYEIFRDGQNHSLHIYNCTVDDAAIYQASAVNTKGIVSCSGVLEVDVMSEYKIHQRYFAKLKQKAENKRRELEAKENQRPGGLEAKENQGPGGQQDQLRTISPDRSQRKRRSTMEASLSNPSSMEDEGTEESHQAPVAEAKARLQETAMGGVEEKPVPVTNGAALPITNGQAAKENGNKGPLYVHDSVQKSFTAHQPKNPFAKKKIKISNGGESVKADTLADTVSEGVNEAGVAPAPTQSIHSQGPSEEVMEVENTVYPSAVASNHIKATENCQKVATDKALPVKNMSVAKEKARMEGKVAVPSHKEQPVVPIPPVPRSSTLHKEQPVVPIPPVPRSPTLHKEQPVVPIPPVPGSSTLHKEQPVVPIPPVPKSPTPPVPWSSTLHKEQPVVPTPPVRRSSTRHKEQPVVPIPPVPASSTLHKEQPVVPTPPVPASSTLHKEQPVVPTPPVPRSSTRHKEQPVVPIPPVPVSSTLNKEQPVVPTPPVPASSTLHKEQPVVPTPPVPASSTLHKEQPVVPTPPVPRSSTRHKEQPVVPTPPVPRSSTRHKEQPVVPIPPVPVSSTLHKEQPVVPTPPVPRSSTLHKEQPVVPTPPVRRSSKPLSSRNVISSVTESKQAAKLEKDRKVRHNEKAENHKSQSQNPPIVSSQLPFSPVVTPPDPSNSTEREDVSKTEQQEDVAVMEVDEKPLAAEPQHQTTTPLVGKAVNNMAEDSATVGPRSSKTFIGRAPVCITSLVSEESPCESEDASPRHPREPFRHQLSGAETSPSQRNVSASQPPQLDEVTQARTLAKRDDAPVKSEPRPASCEMDVQSPQRPPSGIEATADDGQTPTLHNPDQLAADKMTQGTWDHSKGSNESHAVPSFTDLQTSPLESPGDGENTPGCNISPAVQVEIAIKTVEGTEIQVDKKVEGYEEGRLEVQGDNLACAKRKVEVENQVVPRNRSEQVKIERTADAREKGDISMTIMDVSHDETERNVPVLKRAEEIPAHPKSPNLKPTKLETVVPGITKNPDKANFQNTNMSEQQIETFKEIPTPASKVISIAELLRSQLKAIGAEPAGGSVTDKSQTPVGTTPFSTTTKTQHASEKSPELRTDHPERRQDPEKPQLGREIEARVDASPPSNIEAKHLEVQQRPAKPEHKPVQSPNAGTTTITAERRPVQSLCAGSPTVDALLKPFVIPPISVIDVGSPLETNEPSGSTVKDNDSVMDTGQESGTLPPVPLKDITSASLSGTENVQIDFSLIMQKEDLTSAAPPRSSPPMISPPMISPPEHNHPLANTVVEMDSGHSPPTIVSSQHSIVSSVMEHDNEKHVQSEDLVFASSLTPEMQLISEAHVRSTQAGSTTLLDQHKDNTPTTGGSQTMQRLATESALGPETQGINTPLNQQESSPCTIDEYSNNDSFTPLTDTESSPLLRKGNGAATSIPAATPQELASGARRKIFIPKPIGEESESTSLDDTQPPREQVAPKKSSKLSPSPDTPSVSPSLTRRSPLLQPPSGQQTPPAEKRSPQLSKKKVALETPAPSQEPPQQIDTLKTEEKPAKDKHNPFKAPQVIRKIRGEPFSDALGHLKLWCQFFNVLSDSTIKWYRDEVEIAEIKRSAGDETQVALAIVQASSRDCGVYGCTITNEYGTDSTDFLLSVNILSGMFLREDLEVGEEIEMTPLLLNKGLADCGVWGNKFFGRVMIKESHVGEGSSHKAWRAKVIYGLEPVFESGNTCVIKVRNPIAYGGKEESNLVEKNLIIAQQECRIQNMAREYCKIFSAEARVIENFGVTLEVIPVYMMYRPANAIPHATVEADLEGVYVKYCLQDTTGRLVMRTGSEVEQKCCALQHWVHQWTNGNLLLTRLEGVDTKITNVGIAVKSTGYQGLSAAAGNAKLFEQFVSQHHCNYYCGLLSLRPLKTMDSLQTPSKAKGSRSPLLLRKMASGSSSPQTARKTAGSPRLPRKSESEPKPKAADAPKVV